MAHSEIKALLFDVFGTVVDWRGSITKEMQRVGEEHEISQDWEQFSLDWRALYQPAMETAQGYKPQDKVYIHSAKMLGLEPAQCMMVAAHNDDLRAAHSLGFKTAYINRPYEYGDAQVNDLEPEEDWDAPH